MEVSSDLVKTSKPKYTSASSKSSPSARTAAWKVANTSLKNLHIQQHVTWPWHVPHDRCARHTHRNTLGVHQLFRITNDLRMKRPVGGLAHFMASIEKNCQSTNESAFVAFQYHLYHIVLRFLDALYHIVLKFLNA